MRTITTLTLKMLQVRANRVCTRISFFISKNGQGNQSLLSTHDQNTAETSQPQAQPMTVDAPSTGRFREASSGREKLKCGSARLCRKKGKLRG